MADKKFVGTFQTEHEVLNKIDELKVEGYSEDDIYVITNDEDSLSIVRRQTDVDLESPDGNWLDKFIAFISGDEPVRTAFNDMGLTEEEANRYYDKVKNGRILLYVDHEYGRTAYDRQTEFLNNYSDPNLGGNLTTGNLDATASYHTRPNLDAEQEESLHLHEERLNVDKERVQTGEVNVGKHVVEEEQSAEVPMSREEVDIERRAVYDETAVGEVFDDGENIHIPVMEERVEVTKRPVVNEEIVVSKREVQGTERVSETVRREEANINRSDDDFVNQIDRDVENTLESKRSEYDPLNDRDRF